MAEKTPTDDLLSKIRNISPRTGMCRLPHDDDEEHEATVYVEVRVRKRNDRTSVASVSASVCDKHAVTLYEKLSKHLKAARR